MLLLIPVLYIDSCNSPMRSRNRVTYCVDQDACKLDTTKSFPAPPHCTGKYYCVYFTHCSRSLHSFNYSLIFFCIHLFFPLYMHTL